MFRYFYWKKYRNTEEEKHCVNIRPYIWLFNYFPLVLFTTIHSLCFFGALLCVSVHLLKPFCETCTCTVNNAATFLMKVLLNNHKSESLKIFFASVGQPSRFMVQ